MNDANRRGRIYGLAAGIALLGAILFTIGLLRL
ncbi:hypothetical protein EDC31_10259 [Acidomonas methanolica]|nr:hypothetical protein EDC31_10259 [Acidomonas methanolica]